MRSAIPTPWITANRVTLLRIVLLPLPTWLLLEDGTAARVGALVLYGILAATDYVDGMMARRYGATVLGGLLDPIADKIFIAMVFVPLAAIGWVPLWIVYAMLMREFVITTLRSVVAWHGLDVKTSMAAKYKTAIQMFAAAFVIYVMTLQDAPTTFAAMAVFSAIAGGVLVRYALRDGRKVDFRLVAIFGLSLVAAGIRALLPPADTAYAYSLIVLAITLYSGAEYFLETYRKFRQAGRRGRVSAFVKYVAEMVLLPAVLLSLCSWTTAGSRGGAEPLAIWLPIFLVVCEFCIGGLDNLLTSEGKERRTAGVLIKSLSQLVLAAMLIAALEGVEPPAAHREAIAWALAAVTAVYTAASYVYHAGTYLGRRTAAVAAREGGPAG